ncbi:MAG TPA: PIN domain-containing protein [Burkholderiales bacterium]|nr:PIN domain-containing protein [Burkholderiales bacterium]
MIVLDTHALIDRWLQDVGLLPDLRFEPVSAAIAQQAGNFEHHIPGDPADRIIAAIALVLGLRLVTADRRLARASVVEAVW